MRPQSCERHPIPSSGQVQRIEARGDLRIGLNGVARVLGSDCDNRNTQFVRQALQQIERAALIAIGSRQEVMGFIDDQHLGLDSAQHPHGERLERNQTLRRGEGRVKGFEEPCEEASLLGEEGMFTMTTGDLVIPAL
jgi:hypothetical protein